MLDPVINFGKLQVSEGYGSSDTSIVVSSGGSSLPSGGGFNVTYWNSTDYPDPSDDPNKEIVRVTAVSGNTLTVTRAQEGTTASTKNTSGKTYLIMLGITAKMITDIGSNLRLPWNIVNVTGTIDGVNRTFTIPTVPADPNSLQLRLGRQPQELGGSPLDFTLSGVTITYNTAPDISLATEPHIAQYQ